MTQTTHAVLAVATTAFLLSTVTVRARPATESDLIDSTRPEEEVTLGPEDFDIPDDYEGPDLSKNLRGQDPTLIAAALEGDIAGFDESIFDDWEEHSNRRKRASLQEEKYLWPNGIVPYTLSSKYNQTMRHTIASAIKEFNNKTCSRFKPREDEEDYVFIHPYRGCQAWVGRKGGQQMLSLVEEHCSKKGVILHEMMHSIGFWHEQNRVDRDDYIEVIEENIRPTNLSLGQFIKRDPKIIQRLGTRYDYLSIMHYAADAHSVPNGVMTIRTKYPYAQHIIGNEIGFTRTDLYEINKLYSCEEKLSEEDLGINDSEVVTGANDCVDQLKDCRVRKHLDYCEFDCETKQKCKNSCMVCKGN